MGRRSECSVVPRSETLRWLTRRKEELEGLIEMVETGVLEGARDRRGYLFIRKATGVRV